MAEKRTLEQYNKLIGKYNLKAKTYIQSFVEVPHKCENGHVFKAQPAVLLQTKKCPVCPSEAHLKKLKNLKTLFKGKIKLSNPVRKPKSNLVKLDAECVECGTEFRAKLAARSIKCPTCKEIGELKQIEGNAGRKTKHRDRVRELKAEAVKKYGLEWRVFGEENRNKVHRYVIKRLHPQVKQIGEKKFKCLNCDHRWKTDPRKVVHALHGCPKCAKSETSKVNSISPKEFNLRVIKESDGILRCKDYVKYGVKCTFECVEGHEFKSRTTIRRCPKCNPSGRYSVLAVTWLTSLEVEFGIKIQHGLNEGEHHITLNEKKVFFDGYHKKSKTVFEFLGNFWHTNPMVYTEAKSPIQDSPEKAYRKTMRRFLELNKLGYNVIFVWEKDFTAFHKAYSGMLLGYGNTSSLG